MKRPRPEPAAAPLDALPAAQSVAVRAAIDAHRDRPGPLLPILHAVQDALGWVPPEAVPLIAHAIDRSRAEVHGVLSFYPDFRTAPPGRHVLRICRAEACQARGARALEAHAKAVLGIDDGQTSADGAFTLEPVYCLGNCGCGPSLLVDGEDLRGQVTPAAFDALLDELAGARP